MSQNNIINVKLNITNGISRAIQMNKWYEEIKNLNLYYVDDFFEIHGPIEKVIILSTSNNIFCLSIYKYIYINIYEFYPCYIMWR
jgi:hypothetical protein